MNFNKFQSTLAILLLIGNWSCAQNKLPEPSFANVAYGTHERNLLDVWIADTTKTTPLVIYIHGGGFVRGSKEKLSPKALQELLSSGISVAAINYRFLSHAPLPNAHYDALRALQFIRFNSEQWGIDKTKIAAFGGSAGAQLCMWLAFSDEMANAEANDPVERESSRLVCAATNGGQTTVDINLWREWIPEFETYHQTREEIFGKLTDEEYQKTLDEISAISIVSSDDPPILMTYGMPPEEPVPANPKKAQSWKIHHVNFGIRLKEKMDQLGVEAELKYPGAELKYLSNLEFFKSKLF